MDFKIEDSIIDKLKEEVINREELYSGDFLCLDKVTVKLPGGSISNRDIIRHPGAVAILAINKYDEILLEYQYRAPFDEVILEIPAGKIDKGEKLIEAAERELSEETGFKAENLTKIGEIYLAAGYSDEIITIFKAEGLKEGECSFDEDEAVVTRFFNEKQIKELIMNAGL